MSDTELQKSEFDTFVVDEGLLCITVKDDLENNRISSDEYLQTYTDVACAKLMAKLKTSAVGGGYVRLPRVRTKLPREKQLPIPKGPSKWDAFAAEKGIKKRKQDKLIYDESSEQWKRRYGYGGANQDNREENWVVEIKDNEPNPEERDFFNESKMKRKELSAKYEYKRLKNDVRNSKIDLSRPFVEQKQHQKKELAAAVKADMSMGKFSEKVKGEEKGTRGFNPKQKFVAESFSGIEEKSRNLKLLDEVNSHTAEKQLNTSAKTKAELIVVRKIKRDKKGKDNRRRK